MPTRESERDGLVVARYGIHIAVDDGNNNLWRCHSRKRIGIVVPGDRVRWQPVANQTGIITAILPRHTLLQRSSTRRRAKLIAANIDQLLIVSANRPLPDNRLIDLYLVNAEIMRIHPILLVNKTDLMDTAERKMLEQQFSVYADIGYRILWTSIHSPAQLVRLRDVISDRFNIFVGQSGVGKSSLIHTLLPNLNIQRAALSAGTGLGRHTTTTATLYRLAQGGAIIDSPGVRHFASWHLEPESIATAFPEFRSYLGQCRFYNCRHLGEDACAIESAVADGRLAGTRYQSYRHIMASLPQPYSKRSAGIRR